MRSLSAASKCASVILALAASSATAADIAMLSDLDLTNTRQDYGQPHKDRSVDNNPISIAGRRFDHGLGSHATSELAIDPRGASRFIAHVGVDDDAFGTNPATEHGHVEFLIIGDGKVLARSGAMHKGDDAHSFDVKIVGVKRLVLRIDPTDDGIDFDHADWADAQFVYQGDAPVTIAPPPPAPKVPGVVLTPKPGPAPRINGARVFGARPGSPVLITIPCTGDRPISFKVDGLPDGLTVAAATGQITGTVKTAGEYPLTIHATNARGDATRNWKIIIRDTDALALTPPMGWNSWNVWGMAVDDGKVRAAADAFISTGLVNHGWTNINIDDGWAIRPGSKEADFAGKARDDQGHIVPNKKFPDMKTLADYVHGKGLKIGIYSSPGTRTCGDVEASYGYEAQDAASFADWGIDYLKYDWCSYNQIYDLEKRREHSTADERALRSAPYALMRDELRKQKRDIVYSLCQYGDDKVWEWGDQVDGQLWRTTGDIGDSWRSMSEIGFNQTGHEKFAKPGRWNDPDMLVVGYVGWGPNIRETKLTPDELYTHISLWSLLSAPLLIGCDLTRLDDFTLGLLTNDEVIDIDQDPLGKQAARVRVDGEVEIWAKPLEDGGIAVGLFNRGSEATNVEVKWADLGLPPDAAREVRDLWRQQSAGKSTGAFSSDVAPHGVRLVKIAGK